MDTAKVYEAVPNFSLKRVPPHAVASDVVTCRDVDGSPDQAIGTLHQLDCNVSPVRVAHMLNSPCPSDHYSMVHTIFIPWKEDPLV